MAWLRRMPMYVVLLVVLAALIEGAALSYHTYVTFTSTVVRGEHNSRSYGDRYDWNGQRLFLQSRTARYGSTCVITRPDGGTQSVRVPRNSIGGTFNAPDFTEVAPQPSTKATMMCSNSVNVIAGDAAVDRARTVNSPLYHFGMPALATIPILTAVGISLLRRTRNKNTPRLSRHGDISGK